MCLALSACDPPATDSQQQTSPPAAAFIASAVACGGKFVNLGNPVSQGVPLHFVAGPAHNGRWTKLYAVIGVRKGGFLLVQMDAKNRRLTRHWTSDARFTGPWGFVAGTDGILYMASDGVLMRFDPKKPDEGIVEIGQPIEGETLIWRLVEGTDGKIYGVTYPHTHVISYDPKTGKMASHGRMDPVEKNARPVIAGKDGWIYAGIGPVSNQIACFNTADGRMTYLLPESERPTGPGPGTGWLLLTNDAEGGVFADIGGKTYRMEGGKGVPVDPAVLPDKPHGRPTENGLLPIHIKADGSYRLSNLKTGKEERGKLVYEVETPNVLSVGALGEDGFAGTILPAVLLEFPGTEDGKSRQLGNLGAQIYSLAVTPEVIYAGGYPRGTLWRYDRSTNQLETLLELEDKIYRPYALLLLENGHLAVGGAPTYGRRGSPVLIIDPAKSEVVREIPNPLADQCARALAQDPQTGWLIAGTSVQAGTGANSVEDNAAIFAFDLEKDTVAWQRTAPASDRHVVGLVVKDGKVFAMCAEDASEFGPKGGPKHVMVLDAATGKVLDQRDFSSGAPFDGSLQLWEGRILGVSSGAVFEIDPQTHEIKVLGTPPFPASTGAAAGDRGIYYGAGKDVWLYEWEQR